MKCVHDFRIWYFDIEVTGALDNNSKLSEAWKPEFAQQEITLIQAYDTFEKTRLRKENKKLKKQKKELQKIICEGQYGK